MFGRAALVLVLTGTGIGSWSAADPPVGRQPTSEQARERFYGVWLEEERTAAGVRAVGPDRMVGYLFGADRWYAWDRRGESSAARADRGVRVDPSADPMRFDLLDGADSINPGIFKFEGDQLVIALAGWVRERGLARGEDYPTRPKAFTSTKDNGVEVSVLRRGKAMYDQD